MPGAPGRVNRDQSRGHVERRRLLPAMWFHRRQAVYLPIPLGTSAGLHAHGEEARVGYIRMTCSGWGFNWWIGRMHWPVCDHRSCLSIGVTPLR
ncbi:hypothetical protein [Cupriavidus basilensis]|uniref:hypothetical protein n=1 Tax=Cupriavidus basilensis TaxID=68895 RepID=UPI003A598BD5